MNNKTAFGEYIGRCTNCQKNMYKHDKQYYVRFLNEEYMFCENCVSEVSK